MQPAAGMRKLNLFTTTIAAAVLAIGLGTASADRSLPEHASSVAGDKAMGAEGARQREAHAVTPDTSGDEADESGDDADEGGGGGADPSTKTLPAGASDTARANAFGQQGERMRAAHQAAREAAAAAARQAAAARPESPGRSAARGDNAGTHDDAGRAQAAAAAEAGRARAAAARAAHPPKGPRS